MKPASKRRRRCRWVSLPTIGATLVAGLALTCSDAPPWVGEDVLSTDANGDGAGAESGDPAPTPASPEFLPCPAGWEEVASDAGGATTCAPWSTAGPETCPSHDQAHFPGESGCVLLGTACREDDDWAVDLPDDAPILYVHAEAEVGGTGTREAPFASIAAALDRAGPGTVVALSRGDYDEAVELLDGITLWGACVAETLVASSELTPVDAAAAVAGSVTVRGVDGTVRNLRLGGARPALIVQQDGAVEVVDVATIDARLSAWAIFQGGRLTGRNVTVVGTRPDEVQSPPSGHGVLAFEGSTLDLSRAVFDDNSFISVYLLGVDTTVTLHEVAVLRTRAIDIGAITPSLPGEIDGLGLGTDYLAEVEVSASIFEGHPGRAVAVFNPNVGDLALLRPETSLTLRDCVIRGAAGSHAQLPGGITVGDARAVLERVVVEDAVGFGLVAHTDATVVLTDSVIRRQSPAVLGNDEPRSQALWAAPGSRIELNRVRLDDNQGVAALVSGRDASLVGTDVVFAGTRALVCASDCPSGTLGTALSVVLDNAHADLTNFRVSGSAFIGVQLARGGAADLRLGQVSQNVIGVNLQTEPFDVTRLEDRVTFVDNETNLDAAQLPVPDFSLPDL